MKPTQAPLGSTSSFLMRWSWIENNQPFVHGAPPKPARANFYPANATKEGVGTWFEQLEGTAQAEATGFLTTIRRGRIGDVTSVPYS